MSITVSWEPRFRQKQKSLEAGVHSTVLEQLVRAFGPMPISIARLHMPILLGMQAAGAEVADLIRAVNEFGSIILTAEY